MSIYNTFVYLFFEVEKSETYRTIESYTESEKERKYKSIMLNSSIGENINF